jgi:UDP-N-acetylglucosamine--N-acetylmuramyl-(pentapeptide) pyrophosphoryl-undecaprenol N-acetylglucosamine transferase
VTMRIVIAGGGTGGHLFPGIAIAEALREKDTQTEIAFVSSGTPMEAKALKEAGLQEFPLPLEKIHRYLTWRLILVPIRLWSALRRSKRFLRQFKPNVVVGMGGYVTGPIGLAAVKLGIPLVLCEQNCYPGLSNRKLADKAKIILSAFVGARAHFPSSTPFAVIGNPIREKVRRAIGKAEARKLLGLDEKLPTIVSVGGSGGARVLTRGVVGMLRTWQGEPVQVLAQCRADDLAQVQAELAALSSRYRATAFVEDMGALYAAADVAILRSGAGMFEALGRGIPLILVPYPFAAANHQLANAREVAEGGAALIVEESEGFAQRLRNEAESLLKGDVRRQQMGSDGRRMARWGSAGACAQAIYAIARGNTPDNAQLEQMARA